jgi:hypothetical protein
MWGNFWGLANHMALNDQTSKLYVLKQSDWRTCTLAMLKSSKCLGGPNKLSLVFTFLYLSSHFPLIFVQLQRAELFPCSRIISEHKQIYTETTNTGTQHRDHSQSHRFTGPQDHNHKVYWNLMHPDIQSSGSVTYIQLIFRWKLHILPTSLYIPIKLIIAFWHNGMATLLLSPSLSCTSSVTRSRNGHLRCCIKI